MESGLEVSRQASHSLNVAWLIRVILWTGSLTSAVFCLGAAEAVLERLGSPDGRVSVSIQLQEGARAPLWSATFRGEMVLTNCGLGLETVDGGELLAGARLVEKSVRSVNERVAIPFGKADHGRDHFNEVRFRLVSTNEQRLDVIFRCYNDAVALRYELPKSNSAERVTIRDERTSFGIADNPTGFVQYLENYKTSHEHQVNRVAYREIRQGALLDLPLTFSFKNGTYLALTEAALRHYAGMALVRTNSAAGDQLISALTPRADGTKVSRTLPLATPWRVALIAERPGALLESTTLFCLNDPPVVADVSWIKPGKTTFHWWNGDVFDGKPGLPMLSFEMSKKYIDFCASNNIPYHGLSSTEGTTTPWYHQSNPGVVPGPDTDVTKPRAGFDLPAIRLYADSKNVRLWTWVHQAALRGRVEEAFAAFAKMGWAGMMVDFFDHDDQDHVEFAEEILAAALRHRILIHLHGIWKPTGLERTYPNLMNHEGALNLEYLKWSALCTPEHDLNMAFTRSIAGPMDYHLGGFRAVPRAEFKPIHVGPNVLGTRCHQLAMYVCYDNPTPMIADYPTAYIGQPGFDFLKIVPTFWDETRVVVDELGQLLVTARRKGEQWFVGGLAAGAPRDLKLPLNFLPAGEYQARVWQDADSPDPNRLTLRNVAVRGSETLSLRIARDGGFVAIFEKR